MEIRSGNTVPMPAISQSGSGGAAMSRGQFEREKKYQAALAVARAMLHGGIIDEADFYCIEGRLREKFSPVLGGFLF